MIRDLVVVTVFAHGFVLLLWVSDRIAGWILGDDE